MDALLSICIVEDNDDLRDSLVEVLGGIGHKVVAFGCAEDLNDAWTNDAIDLLIADLNLPGEDGLALVSRLKRAQPSLRVLMMSTRTAIGDRVRGYDLGADIYLPKPVDKRELLAAVRSLARQLRFDAHAPPGEGPGAAMQVDTRTLQLRGPNGEAPLASVEVAVLSALARAPGQWLEYWQLCEIIGLDLDNEASRSNLAVRMTRLRGRFSQLGWQGESLKSRRGLGYQLCMPLEIR
jgi:DNA-binding response OmpR family regulator